MPMLRFQGGNLAFLLPSLALFAALDEHLHLTSGLKSCPHSHHFASDCIQSDFVWEFQKLLHPVSARASRSTSVSFCRGFAKGWFPKGWFWRMFAGPPKTRTRAQKTERQTPKTGTRLQKTKGWYKEPEREAPFHKTALSFPLDS